MGRRGWLVVLALFAGWGWGQTGTQTAVQTANGGGGEGAQFKYSFENPKLDPASYTMVIDEDGEGKFHSEPGTVAPADLGALAPQGVAQEITITGPLLRQIFGVARSHHFFAMACESTKDKVAFTGKKLMSYKGSDGAGACTFNYSRDQQLNQLADELAAVAFTINAGRRIRVEHEHDRLSLDAELESLMEAARNGQALQLQNIAPTLELVASDEAVLSRARARANKLLVIMKMPVR